MRRHTVSADACLDSPSRAARFATTMPDRDEMVASALYRRESRVDDPDVTRRRQDRELPKLPCKITVPTHFWFNVMFAVRRRNPPTNLPRRRVVSKDDFMTGRDDIALL